MKHQYEVSVTWTGNTGSGTSGYRSYRRDHTVRAPGLPEIAGSADRTFHGDPARWNPEQLLLVALSQCHLLSYLHVCSDEGVVVHEYIDRATGTMVTEPDGSGRFTEVVLHPTVVVADAAMVTPAIAGHARANSLCFIANSVAFPVHHRPDVRPLG